MIWLSGGALPLTGTAMSRWTASLPFELKVISFFPVFSPEVSHLYLSFAGFAAVTVAGVLGRLPAASPVTSSGAVAGGPPLGPEKAAASART